MKAILVSYLAGMSGDFLSYMIHRDPKFYPITDSLIPAGIKTTEQNMWIFPNLLKPLGLEAKIYPHATWAVDQTSLNMLHEIYGDKTILLPSHWYGRIRPETTNGLFDQAIRLYVNDRKILKICYAMWWIKSHTIANGIWPHRQEEIEEMLANNHPNKELLLSILDSYDNWKFISIKFNLLNNGQLDLSTYVRKYFDEVYIKCNHTNRKKNYFIVDVDNLIYGDLSNLSRIEEYLDVNIDRDIVKKYTQDNYQMLEQHLGISVNSREFDHDETYFDAILNYAKEIIDARPNQFDYYRGKRS